MYLLILEDNFPIKINGKYSHFKSAYQILYVILYT